MIRVASEYDAPIDMTVDVGFHPIKHRHTLQRSVSNVLQRFRRITF